LTRRQREVLQGLAEELTNKQIAQRLGMSQRIVFNHWAVLKQLLHVNTLAQAAAVGRMIGLCQPVSSEEGNLLFTIHNVDGGRSYSLPDLIEGEAAFFAV
jgi:DNA-binding CsgD family transcriptional regulator